MLRSLGIPASSTLVRFLALGEILIALAALAFGGPVTALAVTAAYIAFSLMMYLLVRKGSTASCGCFGQADTPPSSLHIVSNALCALVAATAAALNVVDLTTLLSDQPAAGIPMVLFIATGSASTIAIFTLVGRLTVPATGTSIRTFGMNS